MQHVVCITVGLSPCTGCKYTTTPLCLSPCYSVLESERLMLPCLSRFNAPGHLGMGLAAFSLLLSITPLAWAHHGGEGAAGATALPGTTATTSSLASLHTGTSKVVASNSLWGTLLLQMAIQRDHEIQRLNKKLGRVGKLTLWSVAGISGLGLAQSVSAYNEIKPRSYDITEAHHEGGHDHVHIEEANKTPATLGIIGSSATIATLGVSAVMNHRYSKKMTTRQEELKAEVERIIHHLKSGGPPEAIEADLISLVGEEASQEFLELWGVTHPKPSPTVTN